MSTHLVVDRLEVSATKSIVVTADLGSVEIMLQNSDHPDDDTNVYLTNTTARWLVQTLRDALSPLPVHCVGAPAMTYPVQLKWDDPRIKPALDELVACMVRALKAEANL